MTPLGFIASCRRHPSAILLFVQLGSLVLYPFIENTDAGRVGFGVFGVAVLIVTTRMVSVTPGLTWVSMGIALPAIVLQVMQVLFDVPLLVPWSAALEAIFYFYAAASLISYMMADNRATTDELFAAAATFTLIAWGFTWLFLLLQALQPGSFSAAVDADQPRTWTELLFLSFAVLSGVGLSDVIPLRPVARSIVAVEMFVGVMYIAAVVSRLIGLTIQRGGHERD